MSDTILRNFAVKSVMILFVVVIISIFNTSQTDKLIYAKNNNIVQNYNNIPINMSFQVTNMFQGKVFNNNQLDRKSTEYSGLIETISTVKDEILSGDYIKIKKNGLNNQSYVRLDDLYMERSLSIQISGINNHSIKKELISCNQRNLSDRILKSVNIQYNYDNPDKKYSVSVKLGLDNIYSHSLYQDNEYLYIVLKKPKDVYDKVLVVDAGHGGNDAGTYSSDLKYLEKDLNLAIVLELKKLLDQENIKVYYSRLEDNKLYLKQRVNLANDLDADFFISVHCNSSKNRTAHGAEVLYDQFAKEGVINSKKLASICLTELVDEIGLRKRDIVDGNSTYIIGHSKVPVALIEVGYMSNNNELSFLVKKENQKLIAKGIYNGIIKAYSINNYAEEK